MKLYTKDGRQIFVMSLFFDTHNVQFPYLDLKMYVCICVL